MPNADICSKICFAHEVYFLSPLSFCLFFTCVCSQDWWSWQDYNVSQTNQGGAWWTVWALPEGGTVTLCTGCCGVYALACYLLKVDWIIHWSPPPVKISFFFFFHHVHTTSCLRISNLDLECQKNKFQQTRGLLYKGCVCTKTWRTPISMPMSRCIKSEMEMCSAPHQLYGWRPHVSTKFVPLVTLRGDAVELLIMWKQSVLRVMCASETH